MNFPYRTSPSFCLQDSFRSQHPSINTAPKFTTQVMASARRAKNGYNINTDDIVLGNKQRDGRGAIYHVGQMLGFGTYSRVMKCVETMTRRFYAIKVVNSSFDNIGVGEQEILKTLNRQKPEAPIVQLVEAFRLHGNICIVTELLGHSLYDEIKRGECEGLNIDLVSKVTRDILLGVDACHDCNIIHCDLKPENILVERKSSTNYLVRIADFGSAFVQSTANPTVKHYVQSRFYRSPEIIIGLPCTTASDVWSIGCIVFELFIGIPLFQGKDEIEVIAMMTEWLGLPSFEILSSAHHASKYFEFKKEVKLLPRPKDEDEKVIMARDEEESLDSDPDEDWLLNDFSNTEPSFESTNSNETGEEETRRGFSNMILTHKCYRYEITDEEKEKRKMLISFLSCALHWDPSQRWTVKNLLNHPFITGVIPQFSGNTTRTKQ